MVLNTKEQDIRKSISFEKFEAISNGFFSCEDASELTQKAFDAFNSVFDLKYISLFLLDKKSFEFIHYHTEGNKSSEEAIELFRSLVDDGLIADIVNSSNEAKEDLVIKNLPNSNFCVCPLIVKSEILGMLLFFSENKVEFTAENRKFIFLTVKIFATILNNYELVREVSRVKEVSQLNFEEKTNEIIQSSRELKTILDYLYVGIFITDESTCEIVDVNLMAQKTIGLSKEEIIGKKRSDFFFFIDENERPSQLTTISEGLMQTGNGSVIPIIHKSIEITLEKENFLVDNFMDISERKTMEIELQKAHDELEQKVLDRTVELTKTNTELKKQIKERIKAEAERMKLFWAVHQSPAIIIITDLSGKIEYVNPSFEKITGFTEEEVIGQSPRFLSSGELKREDFIALRDTIENGTEWRREFQNVKKNGERFWVSSTISPVKNELGEITNFIAVQEDITEKKKVEAEIIIAKEKAEESALFREKLLANMSHEFRTPLISIIGFTEFLKEDIEDPEQSELVSDINSSGLRLLKTLNNVLLLSQLESQSAEYNLTPAKASEKIEELLSMHVMAAEVKGIKLKFIKEQDPIEILIDNVMFTQMMDNLIDNAIKYTEKGSVTISTNVRVINNEQWCCIQVKDTGIGIADTDKKIVFEAFKQVSEGYSRVYDGAGLGLTLAKKTAKLMGGDILLESKPLKGSTFTVILPINKNANLPVEQAGLLLSNQG